MTFTVRPSGDGGWLAFASGPRLLVTPTGDDALVDAAWAAISEADGFRRILDLLTANGVAATPHFVLVEWIEAAEARIILRGPAPLVVTDASGSEPLSAAGVSTWVERSIPAVTGIHFGVPGAVPLGTVTLPFEAGVALVSEITFAAPAAPAATAVAQAPALPVPAPEAEPEPEAAIAPEADPEATVREAPTTAAFLTEASVASPDETDAEGYDYLFGDTMYRSVADAVVHEPADTEADSAVGDSAATDSAATDGASTDSASTAAVVDDTLHDGETVLTSDIAKIRGTRRPASTPLATVVAAAPQLVLAISTTGARESLEQPILVGRSPSVSKVSGGVIPRLLTVGTPEQDISRNHVQVSLEGGTVVVTDLHSRNGTMVELPGKSPQKLRAGEPTSIIVGTVIDLGSGVTLTVEDDAAEGEA
jgi:FHA domain